MARTSGFAELQAARETDVMKLVIAIIKPFKLDDVRDALTAIGVARHDRRRGQGLSAARRATPRSIAAPNTR